MTKERVANVKFESKADGTVDVLLRFDKKAKYRFVANLTKTAIYTLYNIEL